MIGLCAGVGSRAKVIFACALLSGPGLAAGQILPPVPPAKAPEPEFVPPPSPPPITPPSPDASAPAAPSLVQRDADGRLLPPATSLDEAIVERYPLDELRRAKANRSIAKRRGEIERFVVEHLGPIRTAAEAEKRLDSIAGFEELFKLRNAATPLAQERLLDRLQRDGAISPMHRVRMDEAIREYETARMAAWKTETGSDPIKIARVVARQGFTDMTREVFAAMERLADRLLADDAALLALRSRGASDDAIQALRNARPGARRDVLLDVGTDDQLGPVLRTVLMNEPEQK